jgi:hypothetical protein
MELRKPRPWCCPHDVPADETCAACGRTGIRDAQREPAQNVMTMADYIREIERTAAFYKGCTIGVGIGTAIGAAVVAALVYFLG